MYIHHITTLFVLKISFCSHYIPGYLSDVQWEHADFILHIKPFKINTKLRLLTVHKLFSPYRIQISKHFMIYWHLMFISVAKYSGHHLPLHMKNDPFAVGFLWSLSYQFWVFLEKSFLWFVINLFSMENKLIVDKLSLCCSPIKFIHYFCLFWLSR